MCDTVSLHFHDLEGLRTTHHGCLICRSLAETYMYRWFSQRKAPADQVLVHLCRYICWHVDQHITSTAVRPCRRCLPQVKRAQASRLWLTPRRDTNSSSRYHKVQLTLPILPGFEHSSLYILLSRTSALQLPPRC